MDGDIVAGLVLSQICYWSLPSEKNGKSKLAIEKDGRLWLAKRRADWWDECRVHEKTAKRALEKMKKKGLVETALFMRGGAPVTHIWLNQERLVSLIDQLPDDRNAVFGISKLYKTT